MNIEEAQRNPKLNVNESDFVNSAKNLDDLCGYFLSTFETATCFKPQKRN